LFNYHTQVSAEDRRILFLGDIPVHLFNDAVSKQKVIEDFISKVNKSIKGKILSFIRSIRIGYFAALRDKGFDAVYYNGVVFMNAEMKDGESFYRAFVHELGHAVEESFQEMVYEDSNLIHEFMVKKAKLLEILENHYNLAFSKEDFSQMHTTSRMDEVFEEIGYSKLTTFSVGIFVSPYAAYSIREYFSRGFEDFFASDEKRSQLRDISPVLYEKIESLFV